MFKTRIQTSTNRESVIPVTKKKKNKLTKSVKRTLEEFSVGKNPNKTRKNIMVKIVDGYCLLRAPVGSEDFAEAFLPKKAEATREGTQNLGKAFPDK